MKIMSFGSVRLLTVLLSFFLFSCGKDNDKPKENRFYIKATIDGQTVEFDQAATIRKEANSVGGLAFKNSSGNFPFLDFDIESPDPITTGTYRESDPDLIMVFRYGLSSSEIYDSEIGEELDFKIQITSITSTTIEGTFEGTIQNSINVGPPKSVTGGRFVLLIAD